MDPSRDVVVLVMPDKDTLRKTEELLTPRGIFVMAITDLDTTLPKLSIGGQDIFKPYCALAAGWATLVAGAMNAGQNLDEARHARKVGNHVDS